MSNPCATSRRNEHNHTSRPVTHSLKENHPLHRCCIHPGASLHHHQLLTLPPGIRRVAHKRGLALYALRKNDRHLGVIAIDGDRVKEMHLSVSMDQYPRVWREMRDFLVRRHGPLRDASIRHNGIVARFIRNC